jgi:hypothetical protein
MKREFILKDIEFLLRRYIKKLNKKRLYWMFPIRCYLIDE